MKTTQVLSEAILTMVPDKIKPLVASLVNAVDDLSSRLEDLTMTSTRLYDRIDELERSEGQYFNVELLVKLRANGRKIQVIKGIRNCSDSFGLKVTKEACESIPARVLVSTKEIMSIIEYLKGSEEVQAFSLNIV